MNTNPYAITWQDDNETCTSHIYANDGRDAVGRFTRTNKGTARILNVIELLMHAQDDAGFIQHRLVAWSNGSRLKYV